MTQTAETAAVRSQRGTILVDLSLVISNGMPAHALFPSPIILSYVSHEQAKSAGLGTPEDPFTYAVNYVSMLDHVGTHVDAPLHIGAGGASIDEVSLDWFTGKAVCLDLRHVPDLGDIDVGELKQAEEQAGVHIDGHIVLLCTGFHARHWPNREVVTMNPGLTADASYWLADRSRVHGVEGPLDRQSRNEGVSEPPDLPRPRDDPLRVARQPRATRGQGRVPVHRLPAQVARRERVARAGGGRAPGVSRASRSERSRDGST